MKDNTETGNPDDRLFSFGPQSIREFVRRNHVALLYTLIIHLVVLIVLIFVKVDKLKETRELGVTLDFTEAAPDPLEELPPEIPAEFIEQVLAAREAASNRAVNLEDIEKENLSTDQFVRELIDELEAEKDEDFLRDREKWEEIIASHVYEEDTAPDPKEEETEEEPFSGPTTITIEFLEPPAGRGKRSLTIPVYRCEGSALVVVEIVVRQNGTVADARIVKTESVNDDPCFSDAALAAALSSTFARDNNAPGKQNARITYQFIAQ